MIEVLYCIVYSSNKLKYLNMMEDLKILFQIRNVCFFTLNKYFVYIIQISIEIKIK